MAASAPRRRGPVSRAVVRTVLALVAVAPIRASAQEGCEFVEPTTTMVFTTLAGGATITNVGAPHMFCADGVEIWADSAISYSTSGMDHLIGGVRFIDDAGELNADEARYFARQGRLQATGNVFVQDTIQGYTIENGNLVYLRETDFRDQPQITVTIGADAVKPRAILYMKPAEPAPTPTVLGGPLEPGSDSLQLPAPDMPPAEVASTETDSVGAPYIVDANRIFIQGNTYFRATGDVEIERESLHAFADSAEYDQTAGRLRLQGSARVEGATYDLLGRTINLALDGNDISRVVAQRDALLTGEDLQMDAPEIRLYLTDSSLDRLVAVTMVEPDPLADPDDPPARPIAFAVDFELTADSIDVVAPGEVLQQIFAAGSARSVSVARDSLNVEVLPEIARSDWLEGDTVIVTFRPNTPAPSQGGSAAADTAQAEYRIERIVARVDARSLYRLIPSDTTAEAGVDPPAIHYVVGNEITISMVDGEVDNMDVQGQTRGVHLEPLSAATPDSLVLDTATVDTTSTAGRRDTVSAPRSTSDRRHPKRSEPSLPTTDPAALIEPWRHA